MRCGGCGMNKGEQINAAWMQRLGRPGQRKDDDRCPEMRTRLAEAQNWKCCYCGCRMTNDLGWKQATFEHIIPRQAGGRDVVDNLVIACNRCNNLRKSQWRPEHAETLEICGCGLPADALEFWRDVLIPARSSRGT